jgi:hypothetical protein
MIDLQVLENYSMRVAVETVRDKIDHHAIETQRSVATNVGARLNSLSPTVFENERP